MNHVLGVVIPHIDYKGLSPLFAVAGGSMAVLLVRLFRGPFVHRVLVPLIAIGSVGAAVGLTIWSWDPGSRARIISGEYSIGTIALGVSILFYVSGILAVLLSMRGRT